MYGFYGATGAAPMGPPYGGYFGMEQDIGPMPYGYPPQDVLYGNDLFYGAGSAANLNGHAVPTTNAKRGKNAVSDSGGKVKKSKKSESTKDMSPGRRVNKIQKQLEYYFSPANMDNDTFLRESMDANGWVHIDVITAFNPTNIEVDTSNPDRIRMAKLWKEYVRKNREKRRREERKKQRELDEREVNTQTIDDIV